MKKLISGLLAAAMIASCALAPDGVPFIGGCIVEASAAAKLLKAPSTVKVDKTPTSITLKWNKITDAAAYRIFTYDASIKKYVEFKTVKKASCTISGLKPGTEYKFKIAALKLNSKGKYALQVPTKGIAITTKKLSSPASIKAVPTESSIKFTWSAVEGADAYQLTQYDASKKAYVSVGTFKKTTCTIKGVSPGHVYKFKIAPLVKSGKKYIPQHESAVISVTITKDGQAPEHVSGYRGGDTYPAMKHDLEYMYKLNTDFIGWLTVADTPIDGPVVQATNNKFYLEHDFYGRYDKTKVGTTFADSAVPVTAEGGPDNLVIYGHNIRTGVGLAKITNYYPARYGSLKFYINHPTVTYESIYGGQSTYVVFAGMFVNTEQKHGSVFQYYKFRNFNNKSTFYQYFEAVFDRSVFYNPDIDIDFDDEFLTLSTCYYPMGSDVDTRFVVFARKVRKGEKVISTANAYTNPSPLYFDYYYKVNGGKWAGRKWSESLMKGYSEWKKKNS